MKKIVLLTLVCIAASSCKKTWQCECKQVYNYEDWNPIVTNIAIEDEKEKDAETICKSLSNDFGYGNYKTCTLKK